MTQAEFKAWADKNIKLLVRASIRYFGNADYVGEIYERTVRSICAFDERKGKITTFVYAMAWRCQWETKNRAKKQVAECRLPDFADLYIPAPPPDIHGLMQVDAVLDALTPRQKEVAVRAMVGETSEEIASRYGYSRQYGHKVLKEVREIAQRMAAA